jgi:hypothetical protein
MATEGQDPAELIQRLELIERMVHEGRQVTEHWGWAFVLWGVGHLAALAGSAVWPDTPGIPWTLTMWGCGLIMVVVASVKRRRQSARGATSRAVGAIWSGFACSILLIIAARPSGLVAPRLFVALILLLLGSAHMASGIVLRWRAQRAVGAVWWAASLVQVYAPPTVSAWFFAGTSPICASVLAPRTGTSRCTSPAWRRRATSRCARASWAASPAPPTGSPSRGAAPSCAMCAASRPSWGQQKHFV